MKTLRIISAVLVLLLLAACAGPAEPEHEETLPATTQAPPLELASGEVNGIVWREIDLQDEANAEIFAWLDAQAQTRLDSDSVTIPVPEDNLLADIPEAYFSKTVNQRLISPDARYYIVQEIDITEEPFSYFGSLLHVFDLQNQTLVGSIEVDTRLGRMVFRDERTIYIYHHAGGGIIRDRVIIDDTTALEITLP